MIHEAYLAKMAPFWVIHTFFWSKRKKFSALRLPKISAVIFCYASRAPIQIRCAFIPALPTLLCERNRNEVLLIFGGLV